MIQILNIKNVVIVSSTSVVVRVSSVTVPPYRMSAASPAGLSSSTAASPAGLSSSTFDTSATAATFAFADAARSSSTWYRVTYLNLM